jgi:hypothetical protein
MPLADSCRSLCWGVRREGRRIAGAGWAVRTTRHCCSESHVPLRLFQPARRELTPVLCSVRLSWHRRARPSTTLHEIQICRKADWNNQVVTQSLPRLQVAEECLPRTPKVVSTTLRVAKCTLCSCDAVPATGPRYTCRNRAVAGQPAGSGEAFHYETTL